MEPLANYGRLKFLVNGKWVDSESQEVQGAYNPATGQVIAQVPFGLREEVDGAIESAAGAFESWKNVPITERVNYLFKMRDMLERHFDELAIINTQNHGKILEESEGEVRRTIENVDTAISIAYTLSKGNTLDQIAPGIDEMVTKEPLGVFSIVCPFNFPLMVPSWFIPYAIVLGDTVVVKPSEVTPIPMQQAAKMVEEEVRLPPGVLNVVHGGRQVVEHLIKHNDVRGVTVVGSTPVAKNVYKLAGENGKRAIANGGAKNSIVVMPDADLGRSIPSVVSSFFGNAGQRCLAGANLVAVGDVHDELVNKFASASSALRVGNGLEETVQMGPVVSGRAKERILSYIEEGIEEGAKPITDGRGVKVVDYPNGFYLGPTIFDGVSPNMKISRDEVFGPVASTLMCESLDEAIELINTGTNYGNMATIYTSSGKAAREFRTRVDAGNIGINIGVAAPAAYFPFGGRRDSFFGVLHAQVDTVDFFTDKKVTVSKW
jgi:malonate-semialdehyde dehydrogenase (acetylating)/methylmalonate-semialdehyde dehydrogenase